VVNEFVAYASVVASWVFRDERTAKSNQLMRRAERVPIHVPCIWPIEVANMLLVAERRARILHADRLAAHAALRRFVLVIARQIIPRSIDSPRLRPHRV
jgi:predicted nucleic acid-binding protein